MSEDCERTEPSEPAQIRFLPDVDDDGVPCMRMTCRMLWSIGRSIGSLFPETGGVLGARRGGSVVTHFHFDTAGSCSRSTYAPDIATLNALLGGAWERESPPIDLVGAVHSHPSGAVRLSDPDLHYIERLLAVNTHLGAFLAPIVLPDRQQLIPWIVYRNRPWEPVRARLHLI